MMAGINPRDRARNPAYYAARRAISQHLWHHHHQARAAGTLVERLNLHDDLHWGNDQLGRPSSHTHAYPDDAEDAQAVAHRYLKEGSGGESGQHASS